VKVVNNFYEKKLPVGIQTFSEIISEGHYYVDKTPFAHRLIEEGKYYFLSRPRRFGKSLFLDTLKELFEGNRKYFKGLYIEDKWDWTTPHPVIHISFGGGVLQSRAGLDVRVEDATNRGRIDMTVKLGPNIYLFEFKVVELIPEGRALQQLKDKNYADKYRAEGIPIHLIGVEFSREERNVVGFEIETA